MNKEKVLELAEQSGLEYNFDPMLWLKYEKFAELISQECTQANDFKPDYDAIQELLEEISRLWDIIIDLEEQLRNKNDIA